MSELPIAKDLTGSDPEFDGPKVEYCAIPGFEDVPVEVFLRCIRHYEANRGLFAAPSYVVSWT